MERLKQTETDRDRKRQGENNSKVFFPVKTLMITKR